MARFTAAFLLGFVLHRDVGTVVVNVEAWLPSGSSPVAKCLLARAPSVLFASADADQQPLFTMKSNGREAQNRLPPLSRRLDRGIDCYFEETDALVQQVIQSTRCCASDAAWALEACQGNLAEAERFISLAQLQRIEELATSESVANPEKDDPEWNLDSKFNLTSTNEANNQDDELFSSYTPIIRSSPNQPMRKEKIDDDIPWLPTKNPRPVDDEPWFTG
jgi:hypothetical protein